MKFQINLRHLERDDLELAGEATAEELDLAGVQDELVRFERPVRYELTVSRLQESVLVHGRVEAVLRCECARCLKPFDQSIVLDPWDALLPLEGEESVPIVDDCVDLTPHLREDIVLALPQHPLCKPECRGLPVAPIKSTGSAGSTRASGELNTQQAWAALDQLKLK